MLCKDVFHSSSEVTSTEKERRRTKRGIKDLWNKFNENVKEQFFKQALNFVQQKQHNPECYEDVGCFYRAQRMAVDVGGPAPPKQVGTKITFFDGLSKTGSEVTHRSWASVLKLRKVDLDKPLFVITHGFTSDNDMSWMHTMKEALFNHLQDKCNVILVEWIQGAKFPRYAAAAANSPMPGTLISLLLIEMNKPDLGHLSPESVHLIGFSLGAHVLGFCGRHFYRATGKKLGRITGLDPAGPLFEGTNVSLSFHDAEFVDVIHTHSGSLQERKLGIKDSIGNVDFFPNGGKSQPGCESMLKIGCSHKRARAYFIESLTSTTCHFKSVQCDNGWENYDKCELTEDVSFIGEMGYNSKTKNGRGNQYLRTSSQTPFCIPQKG
uniref:Lipase domain-containing protein n=2 Tax=Amblyomma maculatum TaxID=34609 RepID=G3MMB2_AMBMU